MSIHDLTGKIPVKHITRNGDTIPVVTLDGSATDAAVADNGTTLPLASLAQALSYNADGTLANVQVVYEGKTYQQSMTWTSGNLTAVSAWEVQP